MSDELPGIDVSALAKTPLTMNRVRYTGCEVWVVEHAFGRVAEFATEADAAFYVIAREALAAMEMGCTADMDPYGDTDAVDGVWYVKHADRYMDTDAGDYIKARDGVTVLALAYRVLKAREANR